MSIAKTPAKPLGKLPRGFHRLSGAHPVLCALPFIAAIALASCRASEPSSAGKSGNVSLVEDAGYAQIAPGEFLMGSPNPQNRPANYLAKTSRSAIGPEAHERPQRRVSITRSFEMGKYEVTQEQWQVVMSANPSSFKGPQLPVTNVSWNDAQEFIARLQSLDEKYIYRLPTEAEWEYACRAGSAGDFSGEEPEAPNKETHAGRMKTPEENEKILRTVAWFSANAFNHPHRVGRMKPNAWGLFDMHGNVREWCQDWYDFNYYKTGRTEDPQGPPVGAMKVNRGGGWQSPASMCRSAARAYDLPTERNSLIGFRLVRTKR